MTFGVVTSITMKTVPSPSVMMLEFFIKTPADNMQAFDMLAYVTGRFPDLVDKGLAGYPILFNTVPDFLENTTSLVKGMVGKEAVKSYLQDIAEREMSRSVKFAEKAGVPVKTLFKTGHVSQTILATIEKLKPDMVVMGAKGRSIGAELEV